MPTVIIRDLSELAEIRETVAKAATRAVTEFKTLLDFQVSIDALAQIRFTQLGFHPIEDRRLNLVEQVNQTFTYLVSCAAVEHILRLHRDALPVTMNLGTSSGSDVESAGASIAAEVFAAVRRTNNRKITRDVAKVAETRARHKYVFFYCPDETPEPFRSEVSADVQIIPLSRAELWI